MALLDPAMFDPNAGWLGPAAAVPLQPTPADEAADARTMAAKVLARRMRQQNPSVPPQPGAAEDDFGKGGAVPFSDLSGLTPTGPSLAEQPTPAQPMQPQAIPPGNVPLPTPRPGPDAMAMAMPPQAAPPPAMPQPMPQQRPMPQPMPQQAQPQGQPQQPGMLSRLGDGIANNSQLLLALGAGFAGAPSLGTGMQRAFTNAMPVAGQNQTIQALTARGMPLEMARMAASNPALMNQIAPQLFGPKQLKFGQIGESMLGDKQFGFIDEVRGKAYNLDGSPVNTGSGAGKMPIGPDGSPLQGQPLLEYLQKTDPVAAAGVKSIISGDENASGRTLQKLLPLASLVEPGFSQQTYQTRLNTQKDFTPNGVSGKNLTAINTGLTHLERLYGAIDKLDNFTTLPGVLNPMVNTVRGQFSPEYQANLARYRADVNGVAGELAKVFRSTGMSEADIQSWKKSFDENGSPASLRAAAQEGMHMIDGRIDSIGDAYNRGMRLSTTKPPPELLSPEGQRIHAKLRAMEGGAPASAPRSAAPASNLPPLPSGFQLVQ